MSEDRICILNPPLQFEVPEKTNRQQCRVNRKYQTMWRCLWSPFSTKPPLHILYKSPILLVLNDKGAPVHGEPFQRNFEWKIMSRHRVRRFCEPFENIIWRLLRTQFRYRYFTRILIEWWTNLAIQIHKLRNIFFSSGKSSTQIDFRNFSVAYFTDKKFYSLRKRNYFLTIKWRSSEVV